MSKPANTLAPLTCIAVLNIRDSPIRLVAAVSLHPTTQGRQSAFINVSRIASAWPRHQIT